MSRAARYAVPDIPDSKLYRSFETIVGGYWTKAAYRSWRRRKPLGRIDRDLRVRVSRVDEEGVDVRAIWFESEDGVDLPPWDPGAHVDVVLPSGRLRQYSLNSDPDDLSRYRISVRRIEPAAGGGGGSFEAHHLGVGDRLVLKGPRNAFPFVDSPAGYLFVAGGIGITPILPMLRDVVRRGVPYEFVYTGRSRDTMPFLDELAEIVGDHEIHLWPDDERGLPDVEKIISLAPEGAALYCCGPMPMIDAIRAQIPAPRIDTLHYERFSPPPVLGGSPFRVRLEESGLEVEVGSTESALTAVRRVRPAQAYSCQQGFCGTCRVPVLAGEVEHRDHALADYEREGHMILCVSRAKGTVVIDG
ncbi:ferredoxin-NADP reductase [Nocardioides luteus]|uniref:Oxidoreductase n=1 Tax=Nocardioides luteus TaxID=1844 RepID=A0ABQ5SWQ6_9ACTN|nr:PDR/VanB family oxidoreductase [Nocardioides luteus]MDR7312360.1 ferredoxin-NADP reductase [Nocardioides luteus]GGR57973.1 putative oxidoreductase [Nocardioides luteus]GLJ68607.1 putative oxidoreductase [Nocardioides luteus]